MIPVQSFHGSQLNSSYLHSILGIENQIGLTQPIALPYNSAPPQVGASSLTASSCTGGIVLSDISTRIATSLSISGGEQISGQGTTKPVLQCNAAGGSERSVSRASFSPSLSDSGISVETVSGGSIAAPAPSFVAQPSVSLAMLAKLGAVAVNAQGIFRTQLTPLIIKRFTFLYIFYLTLAGVSLRLTVKLNSSSLFTELHKIGGYV